MKLKIANFLMLILEFSMTGSRYDFLLQITF